MSSAEDAKAFVGQLTSLVERLAARDIVILSLRCEWGSFGSWIIELTDGRRYDEIAEQMRQGKYLHFHPAHLWFTWDGKDNRMLVARSASGAGPTTESTVHEEALATMADAIAFVERYLEATDTHRPAGGAPKR